MEDLLLVFDLQGGLYLFRDFSFTFMSSTFALSAAYGLDLVAEAPSRSGFAGGGFGASRFPLSGLASRTTDDVSGSGDRRDTTESVTESVSSDGDRQTGTRLTDGSMLAWRTGLEISRLRRLFLSSRPPVPPEGPAPPPAESLGLRGRVELLFLSFFSSLLACLSAALREGVRLTLDIRREKLDFSGELTVAAASTPPLAPDDFSPGDGDWG